MQSRDHMNVSSGSERPVRADGRKEGFSLSQSADNTSSYTTRWLLRHAILPDNY